MPGTRCDRASSEMSGWMCYPKVPGTLVNLFYGPNNGPVQPTLQAPALDLSKALSSLGRKRMPFTSNPNRVG